MQVPMEMPKKSLGAEMDENLQRYAKWQSIGASFIALHKLSSLQISLELQLQLNWEHFHLKKRG